MQTAILVIAMWCVFWNAYRAIQYAHKHDGPDSLFGFVWAGVMVGVFLGLFWILLGVK